MTSQKWFIDVSRNNPLTRDQIIELIKHGCVGLVIKICSGDYSQDPLAEQHIALCKELGLPFGLYQWVDPIRPYASQVAYFMTFVEKHKPNFVVPDIEQYWMDWNEWRNVVVLKQPGHIRPFPADTLVRFFYAYLQELRDKKGKLPMMVYSARWFIHSYCRKVVTAINAFADFYWNAYYLEWVQMDRDPNVTWDEFDATIEKTKIPRDTLPDGITTWDAWQFAILPRAGFPKLDCDLITDKAAVVLFGSKPIEIPEEPPVTQPSGSMQMVVTADVLNIRNGPKVTAKDLGDLNKGDLVNILDIGGTNAWIEIEPGKWACVQTPTKRYMEPHTP